MIASHCTFTSVLCWMGPVWKNEQGTESVNEGTKSVLELPKLFLTSYLCELVVINEKNCIHTFSCLLGTFVQLM